MNAPANITLPASPAYESDAHAWAMAQAALLRERRFAEIDLANIIEEIESVGRSERRSLASAVYQIVFHLLKWDGQPERRDMSWWLSIENHRVQARRDFRDNPSLRPELEAIVADELRAARRAVVRETRLPASAFAGLSYTVDDVFDREIAVPDAE